MLKIKANTGNAAFYNDGEFTPQYEICRILDSIKEKVRMGYTSGCIMDINGNNIGEWSIN